jgi:hypothetical protein
MRVLSPLTAIVLTLGATTFFAANAHAQADMRANDAFDFFKAFCVDTDGTRDRALAVIGDGNALAQRLPDTLVSQLQGQPGGVAWAVRSPSNAQLLLGYTSLGMCEIRIAEADEKSVITKFDELTSSFESSGKGQYSKPEAQSQGGANVTFRTYRFERSGRHALIALSSADKRVGEQQHLITFGFVQ